MSTRLSKLVTAIPFEQASAMTRSSAVADPALETGDPQRFYQADETAEAAPAPAQREPSPPETQL